MNKKKLILMYFTCVFNFLNAQVNYYNTTIDYNNSLNGFWSSNILNSDTLIIDGIQWDSFGIGKKTIQIVEIANGTLLDTYTIGKIGYNYGTGLSQNSVEINDTIYAIGGAMKADSIFAAFHKVSIDGDILIDTLYNLTNKYSRFDCILKNDDGNFLILGSKEVNLGDLDVWLLKMDPYGTIIWEQTFDSSAYDGGLSIVKSQNNFLVTAGKSDLVTGDIDLWLIMVDLNGNVIWEKTIGGPYYDGGNAKILLNGDILINGSREYASNFNESYVMRLDNNGQLIWEKSFLKSAYFNFPSSLGLSKEMQDGSIILAGTSTENNSVLDQPLGIIMKLSNSGDSLWSRFLKIRNNDNYLTDLKLLDNGDYLMSGYVFQDAPDNTEDGWIMRTNCLGYFEHPIDSLVFTNHGIQLEVKNLSSYFEYTIIDWGDGSEDTLYDGKLSSYTHNYLIPGNYTVTTTTVACNDTIQKTQNYIAPPSNLTEDFLSIFPNPTNGNFQVWLESEDLYKLSILDASGRLVFEESNILLNTGYKIDLTHLDSAIYFVNVQSEEGNYTERIVIKK